MSVILIADDDEIIVEIVRQAFVDTGHVVGWLADGKSALAMIRQRPPDLVILDCNMPGISGINVLREMRKSADLYNIPVMMLTGRQSETDEQISRFEGANSYVRKPFQPDVLVREVEALLVSATPRTKPLRCSGAMDLR